MNLYSIFWSGGVIIMTLLSVILVALFVVARKAPGYVRPLCRAALIAASVNLLLGIYNAVTVMMEAPDVSSMLVLGAVKTSIIPLIYSLLICLISEFLSVIVRK